MVDETRYRETYHSINASRCAFEKTILSRRGTCNRCKRFRLADREGASCTSPAARERCEWFLSIMRDKARFALKLTGEEEQLPFNKEIKVQTGGMLALQALLRPEMEGVENIDDIHALLSLAEETYRSLDDLPYSDIMPGVVSFEGRKRRKRT